MVAAGPWSSSLDGIPDGARAPIHPIKGQILRLHDPAGPGLLTLDGVWSGRGDTANGVLDQSGTLWDALQKIARERAPAVLKAGGLSATAKAPTRVY